jgi:hypothetical protein
VVKIMLIGLCLWTKVDHSRAPIGSGARGHHPPPEKDIVDMSRDLPVAHGFV